MMRRTEKKAAIEKLMMFNGAVIMTQRYVRFFSATHGTYYYHLPSNHHLNQTITTINIPDGKVVQAREELVFVGGVADLFKWCVTLLLIIRQLPYYDSTLLFTKLTMLQ